MSDRFIPSKENVIKAAAELPEADKCTDNIRSVDIGQGRTVQFRRVKYKTAKGRGYRWLFEGKMSV
ncbi:MAG: hypothetical protein JJT96_08215 [Opitutales bacterium]|nr:hypothetical protein [Opitutales bacterium]